MDFGVKPKKRTGLQDQMLSEALEFWLLKTSGTVRNGPGEEIGGILPVRWDEWQTKTEAA